MTKILVIDDENCSGELLSVELADEGCSVERVKEVLGK